MPTFSLSALNAFNAETVDDDAIVLVALTPEGGDTVYLSSHPTERLSADPLRYGTTSNGIEYDFVLMSTAWPDDLEGRSPSTTLIFQNVTEDMAATARSVTPGTQADVVMSLVLSSAPDEVEESYVMKATGATYNAQQVTLEVSREPVELEPWPAFRMTKERAPALFP